MNIRQLLNRIGKATKINKGEANTSSTTSLELLERSYSNIIPNSRLTHYNNNTSRYSTKDDIRLSNEENEIFDEVIGYYDIKKLFRMAITAEEPVHVLLIGPPASAKTVFMKCLTKLPGSYFTDGSNTTKSGMLDYIFENKPKYILIDEIDKMQHKDQAFLLNLMETGIVSETKHQRTRSMHTESWIFASSNNTNSLLLALKSRFLPIKLEPYSYQQFYEITAQLLTQNNVAEDIAKATAYAVWHKIKSGNIRDCIRIGRMAKSIEDIHFIVDTFQKYGYRYSSEQKCN